MKARYPPPVVGFICICLLLLRWYIKPFVGLFYNGMHTTSPYLTGFLPSPNAACAGQLTALCLSVIVYAIPFGTMRLYSRELYNPATMEERIKKARKALGWSQADLARRMFVSQPSVAAWELGRKAPHTKNLMRLAMLLGVSFEWLSTGRGEMHPSTAIAARESAAIDEWMRPEERRLLSTFSDLKPKQRAALLEFLGTLV